MDVFCPSYSEDNSTSPNPGNNESISDVLKSIFQYSSNPKYATQSLNQKSPSMSPLENKELCGYGKLVFPKGLNRSGERILQLDQTSNQSNSIEYNELFLEDPLSDRCPGKNGYNADKFLNDMNVSKETIKRISTEPCLTQKTLLPKHNSSQLLNRTSSNKNMIQQMVQQSIRKLNKLRSFSQYSQVNSMNMTRINLIDSIHNFYSLYCYLNSSETIDQYKILNRNNCNSSFLESILSYSSSVDSSVSVTPTEQVPSLVKQTFYIGEYCSFKPNGYGTMYYENNIVFRGTFKDGKRDGFGIEYQYSALIETPKSTLSMSDLSAIEVVQIYEGTFKNNLYDGYGIFYRSGQKIYEGLFKEGLPCVYGVAYSSNNILAEYIFDMHNPLQYSIQIFYPSGENLDGKSIDEIVNEFQMNNEIDNLPSLNENSACEYLSQDASESIEF